MPAHEAATAWQRSLHAARLRWPAVRRPHCMARTAAQAPSGMAAHAAGGTCAGGSAKKCKREVAIARQQLHGACARASNNSKGLLCSKGGRAPRL